jgi:hypothetical protein
MPVEVQATSSKTTRYTAYGLTVLFTLFMLMDAGFKFTHSDAVVQANTQLGFPLSLTPAIGVLALILLALYLIPSTSVLGAILFTGYFGGAIALHLRVDNPLFSHTLFPIYIALFLWGGLWLRDAQLRELFPITNPPAQPPASKGARITGYVLSGLGAALILLTAVMKFVYVPPAGAPELFPKHHIHHLGYIEIVCTLLYLFPRTSVLGAVLLSGYLGGATCINLRSGDSLGTSLVPILFSVIPWLGLWLRDLRLRALIPVRR